MADTPERADGLHVRCVSPTGVVHNVVTFNGSGLAVPLVPPGKPREEPFVLLYVLQEGPEEPQELLMARPGDSTEAQRMVSEIAHDIEQGVFDPAAWG